MIERKCNGVKPAIRLPKGAIDTQTHLYLSGYPALEGGPALPEGLPGPDEYRQVMDWLGIDRVVVTQGNSHQRDNANLLAVLDVMGKIARGVAVVDASTSEAELEKLHAAGVRGARIMNLPGGAVGLDEITTVDEKAAAMGWVLAVQFDGSEIETHADVLAKLKSRYIIDHHGKFFDGVRAESPQIAVLKQLIDRGNCWFKFAGVYESSKNGAPDYGDVAEVARAVGTHAPQRIIWGTNWPHNLAKTTEDYPDDAALLDTVLGWIEGEENRRLALVDNPEGLFDFA